MRDSNCLQAREKVEHVRDGKSASGSMTSLMEASGFRRRMSPCGAAYKNSDKFGRKDHG